LGFVIKISHRTLILEASLSSPCFFISAFELSFNPLNHSQVSLAFTFSPFFPLLHISTGHFFQFMTNSFLSTIFEKFSIHHIIEYSTIKFYTLFHFTLSIISISAIHWHTIYQFFTKVHSSHVQFTLPLTRSMS